MAGAEDGGSGRPDAAIACSLDAGSLSQRVDEWKAFVATSVSLLEATGTSVRMTLEDSDAALAAAAWLGAREKACCPFFDVAVELEPDRRVLRLSVPDEAHEALAGFVRLLSS
jgi:hypothetical protein